MPRVTAFASIVILVAFGATNARSEPIDDEAAAIAAAKKYTKRQCNAETPCAYTARREGRQWNVWVEFTKRSSPGAKPRPYSGGHLVLYFDSEGHLVKRIEGQ